MPRFSYISGSSLIICQDFILNNVCGDKYCSLLHLSLVESDLNYWNDLQAEFENGKGRICLDLLLHSNCIDKNCPNLHIKYRDIDNLTISMNELARWKENDRNRYIGQKRKAPDTLSEIEKLTERMTKIERKMDMIQSALIELTKNLAQL